MGYLVLLSAEISICLIIIFSSLAKRKPKTGAIYLVFGFVFLTVGFLSKLVLANAYSDSAIKTYYIFRLTLPLLWIGHGILVQFVNLGIYKRLADYILVFLSLGLVLLVGATEITEASSWYSASSALEVQYQYILATNRLTRGLLLLMNAYGMLVSAGIVIIFGFQELKSRHLHQFLYTALLFLGMALVAWSAIGPVLEIQLFSDLFPILGVTMLATALIANLKIILTNYDLLSRP